MADQNEYLGMHHHGSEFAIGDAVKVVGMDANREEGVVVYIRCPTFPKQTPLSTHTYGVEIGKHRVILPEYALVAYYEFDDNGAQTAWNKRKDVSKKSTFQVDAGIRSLARFGLNLLD